MLNNSCSKLHCQKGSNLILFPYKISRARSPSFSLSFSISVSKDLRHLSRRTIASLRRPFRIMFSPFSWWDLHKTHHFEPLLLKDLHLVESPCAPGMPCKKFIFVRGRALYLDHVLQEIHHREPLPQRAAKVEYPVLNLQNRLHFPAECLAPSE